MRPSYCRTCGAPIIWVRTERGSRMPLNAEPVRMPGPSQFVLRDRNSTQGPLAIAAWGLDPATDPHHVSHFATCPDAAENQQPPQDPGWRHAGRRYRTMKR